MISVIVPVYKVEPYLRQSVDSILGQTFPDFEVILVDDGSPDACGAICDEYAARDSRVRVIHKANAGVSAARNSALDVARGDFIACVDSDDQIAADYLDKLWRAITREDADIALCGYTSIEAEADGDLRPTPDGTWERTTGRELSLLMYQKPLEINVAPWGKLYRRRFFETVRFPEGKVHEDQFVIPRVFYEAGPAVVLREALYRYRVRPGSITTSPISQIRYHDIEGIDQCIRFYKEHGDQELYKAAKYRRDELLARFAIYSKIAGFKDVPEEYRISDNKALRILRRRYPDSHFRWWLGQVHPKLIQPFERWMKVKRILGIREKDAYTVQEQP